MAEKNGSIKEELVEGIFNLLNKLVEKWWIFAIGIIIYLLYIGKLDAGMVDFVTDRFVKLANAVGSLIN